MTPNDKILAIVGPTACGKTHRAVAVARAIDAEIISADSRQVYRGMDVGTGKDLDEYSGVTYHLIDVVPAGHKYNLYEYLRDARKALETISAKNKIPLVVGGTGLYVESLLKGMVLPEVPVNVELRQQLKDKSLDQLTVILQSYKTLHNTTDIDSAQRAVRAIEIEEYYRLNPDADTGAHKPTPLKSAIICIEIPRDQRRRLITERLHRRFEQENMLDEVKNLLDSGLKPDDLIYYGLEYKFLTLYLIGHISRKQMEEQLEMAIHQFAKRQMTWFRGMERRGFKINYLPYDMPDDEFVEAAKALIF